MAKTLAWDFDGTLCQYENGFVHPPVEPPIPGALAAVRTAAAKGYENVIFSVRANRPDGVQAIHQWLDKHGFLPYIKGITAMKPKAVAYIDDRAVHFDGKNWVSVLNQADLLANKERQKGQTV